jgi:hypothetical protein
MVIAAGALAASFSSATFAASSPLIHLSYTGNNYKAFYDNRYWGGAKDYCVSVGGHLVVFNSDIEFTEVASQVAGLHPNDYYWVGTKIQASNQQYKNVTNQSYFGVHTVYNPQISGGVSSDTYLEITPPANGWGLGWESANQGQSFICEFESSPI